MQTGCKFVHEETSFFPIVFLSYLLHLTKNSQMTIRTANKTVSEVVRYNSVIGNYALSSLITGIANENRTGCQA